VVHIKKKQLILSAKTERLKAKKIRGKTWIKKFKEARRGRGVVGKPYNDGIGTI